MIERELIRHELRARFELSPYGVVDARDVGLCRRCPDAPHRAADAHRHPGRVTYPEQQLGLGEQTLGDRCGARHALEQVRRDPLELQPSLDDRELRLRPDRQRRGHADDLARGPDATGHGCGHR